jgi:hypothetical protein
MEKRDYTDPRYKKWRKAVYVRDKFRCQMPGCARSCRKMNAHHIRKWASFPELRFIVSNGVTLCRICHDKIKNLEEEYEGMFLRIVTGKSAGSVNLRLRLMMTRYEEGNRREG